MAKHSAIGAYGETQVGISRDDGNRTNAHSHRTEDAELTLTIRFGSTRPHGSSTLSLNGLCSVVMMTMACVGRGFGIRREV